VSPDDLEDVSLVWSRASKILAYHILGFLGVDCSNFAAEYGYSSSEAYVYFGVTAKDELAKKITE
jgi:hypothetical protein